VGEGAVCDDADDEQAATTPGSRISPGSAAMMARRLAHISPREVMEGRIPPFVPFRGTMTNPSKLPTHDGLFLDGILLVLVRPGMANYRRYSQLDASRLNATSGDKGESSAAAKHRLHFGICKCCVRKYNCTADVTLSRVMYSLMFAHQHT
jgi:hypothetical protein